MAAAGDNQQAVAVGGNPKGAAVEDSPRELPESPQDNCKNLPHI